jgi:hypothetical protein
MASVDYMKDEKVKAYFNWWASSPRTEHPRHKELFYKFVKACLEVDKTLDAQYLRLALYDSFHNVMDEKSYDKYRHNILVWFEDLVDFANTTFP